MDTLYDLFKVKEDATQEEIKTAYEKIIAKADSLPQSDKITEQVRRIKIAYGILSDIEKRKKYDSDLATKRADALLENVQVKNNVQKDAEIKEDEPIQIDEQEIKQIIDKQINNITQKQDIRELKKQMDQKREIEKIQKEKLQKEEKRQERKNKRQARKKQQLKQEMEMQAYGEYLSSQGYNVKYPWTWRRVKRLIITLIAVTITLIILWHIPFIRKTLTDLYEENFIVRAFVNLVISIFTSILNGIKGIFK